MMLRRNDRNLENIPVGALGLIALDGCTEMGAKVNDYLVKWRKEDGHVHKNDVAFTGYEKDTYLLMQKFHVLVLVKPRVSSTNLFVVKTFILWSMYVTIA